jgi:hypothetical protein
MEAALAESAEPADWLRRLEARVLAKASGAFDNYTATAVFLGRRRAPGRRPRLALAALVVALLVALGAGAGLLRCAGRGHGALVFGAHALPAPLLPAWGGAPGARSGPRLH